jgi:hypothetical protein
MLSHKAWNPVSDMSAPRPTPTAYKRGVLYFDDHKQYISGSYVQGGGEKRKLSLRKLRKPRKPREREKYFAPYSEISHTEREKTFLGEN